MQHLQLACIFNNLVTQIWQNLNKISGETQKTVPKFLGAGGKMLKIREKILVFRLRRCKIWQKRPTINPFKEKNSRFLSHFLDLRPEFSRSIIFCPSLREMITTIAVYDTGQCPIVYREALMHCAMWRAIKMVMLTQAPPNKFARQLTWKIIGR